jgi:hypothetical protein
MKYIQAVYSKDICLVYTKDIPAFKANGFDLLEEFVDNLNPDEYAETFSDRFYIVDNDKIKKDYLKILRFWVRLQSSTYAHYGAQLEKYIYVEKLLYLYINNLPEDLIKTFEFIYKQEAISPFSRRTGSFQDFFSDNIIVLDNLNQIQYELIKDYKEPFYSEEEQDTISKYGDAISNLFQTMPSDGMNILFPSFSDMYGEKYKILFRSNYLKLNIKEAKKQASNLDLANIYTIKGGLQLFQQYTQKA